VACLASALVLLTMLIVAALAAAGRHAGGQWNVAFLHVARRFKGVYYAGGWFSDPSAWMQHGEAQGRVTLWRIRSGGGNKCVQMTLQQRDVRTKCEIFLHDTRPSLLPQPRGLSRVEFDWEDFRRRWYVLADDGDEVRHLLSDGVRLAIDQLWRSPCGGVPGEMTISLSPGWLVVRKVWRLPRGVDLAQFVERTCALSDQISLAAATGIEFVVSDEPQLLDEAHCGVCQENLTSDIVVCRRCNTPHHRDCWQYGGGCATYGCGGRECIQPGVAPLAGPHWDGEPRAAERHLKPR
jgi:hypothetical protein